MQRSQPNAESNAIIATGVFNAGEKDEVRARTSAEEMLLTLPSKEIETSQAAGKATPDVHVISSDDEEIVVSSDSGSSFAGFSNRSEGTPNQNTLSSSRISNQKILKRRSENSLDSDIHSAENACDLVLELEKKSSAYTLHGADDANNGNDIGNIIPEQSTPVKKFKHDCHPADDAAKSNIQIPSDQIVEINSNSTTNSQRVKRLQRNSKLQKFCLNLNQNAAAAVAINKCSTESTSEFPVSSPSNPQRPKILKNTLPADSFERKLALIAAHNPQMTLDDKMCAWQCESELSDVEDVNQFDAAFKQHEESKRKILKAKSATKDSGTNLTVSTTARSSSTSASITETEKYDFQQFFSLMLKQLNTPSSVKRRATAESLGSLHGLDKDKPTTSAAAQLAVQRKLKAAAEAETKKRLLKADSKMGQNSTTPPATSSSSDNDIQYAVHPGLKKKKVLSNAPKSTPQKILVYEKILCPSSSEETSQDVVDKSTQSIAKQQSASPNANASQESPIQLRWNTTDEESVFRLHRLNREIDKNAAAHGLIQMRLDFVDQKKDLHLKEKASVLFKTPTVPQKYLQNNCNSSQSENVDVFRSPPTPPRLYLSPPQPESPPAQQLLSQNDLVYNEENGGQHQQQFGAAFHQQHEFCNYLGLTGMSTANAVANAVAELANCNLARRSLRVRHLQHQQEKQRKKSKKEEHRNGNATAQLKSRRSNASNHKTTVKATTSATALDSLTANGSLVPFSAAQQEENSNQKEPEIKILCHITATNKNDVEKQCIEKRRGRATVSSNDTSTCPRSSHSGDDIELEESSSSPTLKINQSLAEDNTTPTLIKHELLSMQSYRSSTQSPRSDYQQQQHQLHAETDASALTEVNIDVENPAHIKKLHEKFQKYLQASRERKPSIYIVQSIGSEEVGKATATLPSVEMSKPQEKLADLTKANTQRNLLPQLKYKHKLRKHLTNGAATSGKAIVSGSVRRKRSRERLHKLLTRSAFNMNQRQLRSRKILIVKTIKHVVKADAKLDKPTQKHAEKSVKSANNRPIAEPLKKFNTSLVTPASKKKAYAKSIRKATTVKLHALRRKNYLLRNAKNSTNAHTNAETCATRNLLNNIDVKEVPAPTAPAVTKEQISKSVSSVLTQTSIQTKDSATQTQSTQNCLQHLTTTATPRLLRNPLRIDAGEAIHVYYEMDVLIVVQEYLLSFWKYSKLINILSTQTLHKANHHAAETVMKDININGPNDWVHLGDCKRLTTDTEIATPYANRICIHNSIPIYVEMRCRELPHERRDCNLLSVYINVYYYQDEDMQAKMHSIQLDAVQSSPSNVIYTTITESRYFVMTWPQENVLGKVRSGLCKYSLTPHLDTLASIREFKSMRHEIRYLECSDDDKLLGFGATQLTIWDHRSGDVLMNFDLDLELGRNLGSMYYPSLEIGQNNVLVLFQYIQNEADTHETVLLVIACSISHVAPSYRILQRHKLTAQSYEHIASATCTGDHLLLTAANNAELWINCSDPNILTHVPPRNTQRFYVRGRTQIIELTPKTLSVDSFANHVLKLVTETN